LVGDEEGFALAVFLDGVFFIFVEGKYKRGFVFDVVFFVF